MCGGPLDGERIWFWMAGVLRWEKGEQLGLGLEGELDAKGLYGHLGMNGLSNRFSFSWRL